MKKQPSQIKKPLVSSGKEFVGEVATVIAPKTVKVKVAHQHRHPLYKKSLRKTKYLMVHNESMSLAAGDRVRIREARPISKTKHFVIVEKAT